MHYDTKDHSYRDRQGQTGVNKVLELGEARQDKTRAKDAQNKRYCFRCLLSEKERTMEMVTSICQWMVPVPSFLLRKTQYLKKYIEKQGKKT